MIPNHIPVLKAYNKSQTRMVKKKEGNKNPTIKEMNSKKEITIRRKTRQQSNQQQ